MVDFLLKKKDLSKDLKSLLFINFIMANTDIRKLEESIRFLISTINGIDLPNDVKNKLVSAVNILNDIR